MCSMIKKKAYRYRIYPTEEQKLYFAKAFGCVRFIYNAMLHDKIEHYKATQTMLNNTPAMYKNEYPFLKEIDSLALANAQLNLERAYKNFFRDKRIGFPKFKKKVYHQRFTTNNQKNTITFIDDKRLKIPKLKSLIQIKYHRHLPEDAIIKSATIERTASGKFYASILVNTNIESLKEVTYKIAIDLGIKTFVVTSNGDEIESPKSLIKKEKRLALLQRALSRKQKGSNNYYKNKHQIAVLHEKIAYQRKDFLHQLSTKLINENQVINIETLDVKNMLKDSLLAKYISDASWSRFVDYLSYKANWYGRTLNKVDKYYASSQICHVCGHKNNQVKNLAIRNWTCPRCKTTHDRDYNASLNILAFI